AHGRSAIPEVVPVRLNRRMPGLYRFGEGFAHVADRGGVVGVNADECQHAVLPLVQRGHSLLPSEEEGVAALNAPLYLDEIEAIESVRLNVVPRVIVWHLDCAM